MVSRLANAAFLLEEVSDSGIKPPMAQMVENHGFWEASYHDGYEGGVYCQRARDDVWFCHWLVRNLAQTAFSTCSNVLIQNGSNSFLF